MCFSLPKWLDSWQTSKENRKIQRQEMCDRRKIKILVQVNKWIIIIPYLRMKKNRGKIWRYNKNRFRNKLKKYEKENLA